VARSFARIFYRNAINVGLPLVEADVTCRAGDLVVVDLAAGTVQVGEMVYQGTRLPDFLMEILVDGDWWRTGDGRKGWHDGMIFPEDYKLVGIKDHEQRGEPVYFSTEFLISRDGPRLYRVKSRGSGFMREVDQLELIASGSEIEFYQERVDTRNRARLIDLAYGISRSGKANTVVFQGRMSISPSSRTRTQARF